jgi:periplasmic protein TonB
MLRFFWISRLACSLSIGLLLLTPVVGQQQNEQSTSSTTGAVYAVGPGISPPRPISSPQPDFPAVLGRGKHRRNGNCVLAFIVDEHGGVRDVQVTRSSDKRMNQQIIDTVKQWKFSPALKDGKPVAVRTSAEIDFRAY